MRRKAARAKARLAIDKDLVKGNFRHGSPFTPRPSLRLGDVPDDLSGYLGGSLGGNGVSKFQQLTLGNNLPQSRRIDFQSKVRERLPFHDSLHRFERQVQQN